MSQEPVEGQAGPACEDCGRELPPGEPDGRRGPTSPGQCECEAEETSRTYWITAAVAVGAAVLLLLAVWNGTLSVAQALKLVGAHFAVGFALFWIRHWRRWIWKLWDPQGLPKLLLVCGVWPYFVVTGHFFEKLEEPAVPRPARKDWADERAADVVEHFVLARADRIGAVGDALECSRLAEDIAMVLRAAAEDAARPAPPPPM